jgi:hypothetical protein
MAEWDPLAITIDRERSDRIILKVGTWICTFPTDRLDEVIEALTEYRRRVADEGENDG